MATYVFSGSGNLSIPTFDPVNDTIVFDNLDAADIASISQTNTSVTVTLTNGNAAVLGGVILASLTSTSFQAGTNSDLQFAIGTAAGEIVDGNVVLGLAGDDDTILQSDNALYYGNQGNDILNGNGFENARIFGGQGNDQLFDFGSGSVVYGGLGGDFIDATLANAGESVTIYGGNGLADAEDLADQIIVTLAADTSAAIYGNAGDDIINVFGAGDASVYGGRGDDQIFASINGGTVVGGLGTDTINVVAAGADASFSVFGGNGTADPTDGADIINVTLLADSKAEVYGNGGADDINLLGANGGTYSVFGGAGNDTISGGGAADPGVVGNGSVIYGGLGADTINLAIAQDNGQITVYGGNGQADAADGNDVITVALTNVAGNAIQTASIFGNGGNDTINVSGAGTATVFGGAGNDTIDVGAGFGAHVLTGGIGNDTFDIRDAGNTASADQIVSITDFAFGQDAILFSGGAVSSAITVNASSVANFAALEALDNGTAGQVTIANVATGSLAGTYALYNDQVVEITGFTGTVNADSFAPLTA
ncbi:MAG: hypothetical protein DI629_09915 [Mesorhizobium amorphae]|nr:MAG: hypothetical protein DI629_09915 [Mesorhizobium amorphae]